jgi:catechol 2,3-dioxygenase-like lactoylglutathione lyase family enzyme
MNENQERQMEHTTEEQAATSSSSSAEWPEPKDDIRVTNLLIVRDIARSRHFYADILGAQVLREGLEGPPAILSFHNAWLVLSTEGGPTDDKPDVVAVAPSDSKTLSSALNLRVTNIHELYERWRALGAEFLTPPKEHEAEIRCYMRDPDGHLLEVGQAKPGAIERLRGE